MFRCSSDRNDHLKECVSLLASRRKGVHVVQRETSRGVEASVVVRKT